MPSRLDWKGAQAKPAIRRATAGKLTQVALEVRTQARRNLTENGQRDTDFLWETIYVATPARHTPVPPDGKYLSHKTGRMVARNAVSIQHPKEGAHVGVAADYGLYPELENSYLYRALTQVAGRRAENAMRGLSTGFVEGDDD